MKTTVALGIIVKNGGEGLRQLLESARDHFDAIYVTDTGSVDDSVKIAEEFGCVVSRFDWVDDFAAARNFNMAQAKETFWVWADADDVLRGAENLRKIAAEADAVTGGFAFPYEYARDAHGNVTTFQWRVRLIRNDGSYDWRGRVHEDLLPLRTMKQAARRDVVWEHHKDETSGPATTARNLAIIEKWRTEDDDPIILYHLANAYFGAGRLEEAGQAFSDFIARSGHDEHKYVAWHRMAETLRSTGNLEDALQAEMEAMKLRPDYPDAYFGAGLTFYAMGEWAKARSFFIVGLNKPFPDSIFVCNPRDYDYNPWYFMGLCAVQERKPKEALAWWAKCLRMTPEGERLRSQIKEVAAIQRDLDLAEHALALAAAWKDAPERVRALVDAMPPEMRSHSAIAKMRADVLPKTESSGKEIAIWCGNSWEEWDGTSLANGIGGSEEAVIRLSRIWAARGWQVTVFGSPGPIPKEIDGVTWRPFWEWSAGDKYDVFISWRDPIIFSEEINAPMRLLDLHDVPMPDDYTPDRLARISRIMVKSAFHRKLLPKVPDEKFLIIGHGVDRGEFSPEWTYARYPLRIVSTSSYDRGIEHLLRRWPKIRAAVPDAELHLFYGWGLFNEMHKADAAKMAWQKEMLALMQQAGVHEHGRVGQDVLAGELRTSGIWAYPCHFPEIFCISAAKAQAAGCIPVVCLWESSLEEVVLDGVKVKGTPRDEAIADKYVDALIEALGKDVPEEGRAKLAVAALDRFDWEAVASRWEEAWKL